MTYISNIMPISNVYLYCMYVIYLYIIDPGMIHCSPVSQGLPIDPPNITGKKRLQAHFLCLPGVFGPPTWKTNRNKCIYLENIGKYHFLKQLMLVLGVKLMEINSNLFSR